MLIIEDAEYEVPDFISELPEILTSKLAHKSFTLSYVPNSLLLTFWCPSVHPHICRTRTSSTVINHIDVAKLQIIQSEVGTDDLIQPEGENTEVMLVNGQTRPVVDVEAGRTYRWRILYSSISSYYNFYFDDPSCSMRLLAKDGVYLPLAPRDLNVLPLYGGARCDVLLQCTGLNSEVNLLGYPAQRINQELEKWNGPVLTVRVSGVNTAYDNIPQFEVWRPCFLANTLSLSTSQVDYQREMFLNLGGDQIGTTRYQGENNYIDTFEAGKLVEITVDGIRGHPYHLHTNHFQIIDMVGGWTDYVQPGDWHGKSNLEVSKDYMVIK